jgi:group I intron endonuclease
MRGKSMQVYLVTNKENGMQYVGQTVRTLEQRWNSHVSYALRGKGHYFAHAIKCYGPEQFTVETLHVCESKEEMDFTEIFYIELLKTRSPAGYNLTAGGEGNLGWNPSKEIREHMGAPKGTKHTPETIAKFRKRSQALWDNSPHLKVAMSERMKGNAHTKGRVRPKEEVDKVRAALFGNQFAKGSKHSEEVRKKRSEDQKAYWANWRLRRVQSGP